MTIRLYTAEDLPSVVKFISTINQCPEHHCLHCAIDEAELLKEIKDFESRNEFRAVLAFEEEELIGVLACDCDDKVERVWLWGPFIKKEADYTSVADALFAYFNDTFKHVLEYTSYHNKENQQGLAFFLSKSFTQKPNDVYVYEANSINKIDFSENEVYTITDYVEDHFEVLNKMHRAAFPNTYYSTKEMVELLKEKNQLHLAFTKEGKGVGYVFSSINPNDEGYIHFLAVHPKFRKQGIGTKLLYTALDWLMDQHEAPLVSLTVESDNHAKKMYQRVGFNWKHTGVATRLKPMVEIEL